MRQAFGGEGLAWRCQGGREAHLSRMQALPVDPRAPGCERLAGNSEHYRVRQGVYRIVYAIHDAQVVDVEVVRVGHRGEVYHGA